MYMLKNISLSSRLRIRKGSMKNVRWFKGTISSLEFTIQERVFHIESNNLGWSLKEGKRDALRKKRRFIIRHVCTLRQSLPTGLVKKYTLDQWGRDTLLILPLVTFLSLLGYHHRGYKAHVWKISHFTFDRLWKLVSSFTWSSLSSKWSRDFKIIDRIINLKFLNSCEFHK